MKWIAPFTLLTLSLSAFGADCALYELKGHVKNVNNDLHLLVAHKTASEKDLTVPVRIQTDFSPYVDKYVAGTFIVEGKVIKTRTRIMGVQKIDFGLFDPLMQNELSTMKKVKELPCPEL